MSTTLKAKRALDRWLVPSTLLTLDALTVVCVIIYPLIFIALALFIVTTILSSWLGWGLVIAEQALRGGVAARFQRSTICSSVLVLFCIGFLNSESGLEPLTDVALRILAMLWLFRLAGGVFVGCLASWFLALWRSDFQEKSVLSTLLSSAAVATMLHSISPQVYSDPGVQEAIPTLLSYLGTSTGICLAFGAFFQPAARRESGTPTRIPPA